MGRRSGFLSRVGSIRRRSGAGIERGRRSTRPAAARSISTRGSAVPNGPDPVAAKASVAPRENTSEAVVAGSPRACSGDMKPGVPTTISLPVRPSVTSRRAGGAEVGEVRPSGRVEEDVRRLDVAVHDALAMGGGERVDQSVGQLVDLVRRERAVLGDPLGERAAREVVHHEHEVVAVVDDVAQPHDAGVVERTEHLRLPLDALASRGQLLGRAVQRQPLERDLLAVLVDPEVDDAHASPADAPDHVVGHRRSG